MWLLVLMPGTVCYFFFHKLYCFTLVEKNMLLIHDHAVYLNNSPYFNIYCQHDKKQVPW